MQKLGSAVIDEIHNSGLDRDWVTRTKVKYKLSLGESPGLVAMKGDVFKRS